jgi:hypothetical protein
MIQKLGPLIGAAGIPRFKYRQRCSSSRDIAAFGSLTSADDHKRSATTDARGQVTGITFVESINSVLIDEQNTANETTINNS